jgi:asparagine synthase (glutamine-hydrolysing)
MAFASSRLNREVAHPVCGIAGLVAHRGVLDIALKGEVERMTAYLRARGPEGDGFWQGNAVPQAMFGHRRLAFIDIGPGGAQPMQIDGGRYTLTFMGEIYNYQALRAELVQQGVTFETHSDSEVILRLYQRDGAAMLRNLRGMFAFAIWDEERRTLFAARDPFGIKPFYYAEDGVVFRFAAQVKALLATGAIETTPEPAGEVGFLMWGSVPEPFTLYRQIRALPAGHSLILPPGGPARVERYFSVAAVLADAERAGPPPSGAARLEAIRGAIEDTVRHHMIADVPVGLFLSSGLDSSLVAQYAVSPGGFPTHSVTLGFKEFVGSLDDETELAAKIGAINGTVHSNIWITRGEFAAERDRLLAAMDQPTIDGTNVYFVSRAAKSAGLKAALSGLGGDEVFAGYPSFRQLPRMVGMIGKVPAARSVGRALRVVSGPLVRHLVSPKYAGVLELGGDWSGAYLLRRGLFMPWELVGRLDADYLRQGLRDLDTHAVLSAAIAGVRSGNGRVSALELSFYMRNQLLRDADWAGMAHSIEIRVPFVDAEFFRKMAPLIVSDPPVTKPEVRGVLRPEVRALLEGLPKRGFQVPMHDWVGAGRGGHGWRAWALQVRSAFAGVVPAARAA